MDAYVIGRLSADLYPLQINTPLEDVRTFERFVGGFAGNVATGLARLGVSVATSGDVRDQPKVADGASELLQDIFGKEKNPSRLVYGVASLPLGAPVELEIIFEVAG